MPVKRSFLVLVCLLFSNASLTSAAEIPDTPFIYFEYQRVLEEHVDTQGGVNYEALAANPADLAAFIHAIEKVKPAEYSRWSDPDKIAFWINVYNGFTLNVVSDHYPIRGRGLRGAGYPRNSIRQIRGVWDKFKLVVLGEELSLNDIEHKILRHEFEEPGIHVALVCAARSCPPLRREPYTGDKLEYQLDDQARIFISRSQNFRIDQEKKTVHLSSIFKWYKKDFIVDDITIEKIPKLNLAETAVMFYLLSFIPKSNEVFLLSGGYRIKYLKYDWSLNEKQQP